MQIQLRDKFGKGVPGISISLSERGLDHTKAIYGQTTDRAGNTDLGLVASGVKCIFQQPNMRFTLHINFNEEWNPAWESYEKKSVDVDSFDDNIIIELNQNFNQPTQIIVDGKRFVVGGQTWKYHSVTAFTLLKDFIDGKDISPFLQFARNVKANTLRVFGMVSWADFYPQHIGDYYNTLDIFLRHCQENGFFVEFCIFASANEVMPSYSKQMEHFSQCIEILVHHPNVLVSYSNENDLGVNNINLVKFPTINNFPCSSGSSGGDVDPPEPIRHFTEFHLGRNNEWPRKAKSAREFADKYNVPCINNETNRPDLAGYLVEDFKDCGLVSGLLTAGTNAHSEALKCAQIPTGKEYDCVAAILDTSTSIDNDVYLGNYVRGTKNDDGPCPMHHTDEIALRTFAIIKEHRAWAVIVQPKANNSRKARDGWEITYSKGNYFELRQT